MFPIHLEPRDPAFRRLRAGRTFGRTLLGVVLLIAAVQLLIGLFTCEAHAEDTSSSAASPIHEVGPIGIVVSDLDELLPFYTNVLTFERIAEHELVGEELERLTGVFGSRARTARLRLGTEQIELTEFLAPQGRPIPADSRSNDGWFQHVAIITGDIQRAYKHLRKHGVRHASSGPQRLPEWNKNAGGIEAFYFKDPDGHLLEILAFPPDKGDPKWSRLAAEYPDRLFLGIDHTAIVVGDTDSSLRFYRDRLGFRVAGESENFGIEQERLNNVFGARLRITALRLGRGPAIELLEYLAPSGGRPYPADSQANDLWSWQTTLVASDVRRTSLAVPARANAWVSPDIVPFAASEPGFSAGFLLRDPDGHLMRIIEP